MHQSTQSRPCLTGLAEHLRPDLFKALSDPSRLALLTRLAFTDGPQSVSQIASCCGAHISGASRHLKILRDVGLVVAEKRGRERVYTKSFSCCIQALRDLADAMESSALHDEKAAMNE